MQNLVVPMRNFVAWRPQSLSEFKGQQLLMSQLDTEVPASIQLMQPLLHMLFWGPPGLGKTTLAKAIAKERGVPFISRVGEGLTQKSLTHLLVEELYEQTGHHRGYNEQGVLVNPAEAIFPVILIDEAEKLPRGIMQLLHTVLESDRSDGVMTFQGINPFNGQQFTAWVPRFTMIVNTNYYGDIVAKAQATESRFKIVGQFQFYDPEESYQVALNQAQANKLPILPDAARLIAARSHGIPRTICHLLERSMRYMVVAKERAITRKVVERLLESLGIDEHGLDPAMRQYLKILADAPSGKMAVQALASMMRSDVKTLEHTVEPA
ncbi:MAG: AAA family ATPase, partial [Phycisphaerales bacterium]|nr:AAA family ATPase [Phycisphaerales bacterium]